MNFVENHGGKTAEELPALLAREHQIEALRRGDEDLGRVAQHRAALVVGGVARAGHHPNGRERTLLAFKQGPQLAEGGEKIQAHVAIQGLKRRQVESADGSARPATGYKVVDGGQKCCQGLAAASRRADQHMLARGDDGPRLGLRVRGRAKAFFEPPTNQWMKLFEGLPRHARELTRSRRRLLGIIVVS